LLGLNEDARGREWTFTAAFLVGRVPQAGMVLDESGPTTSVSARHAYIWRQSTGWWMADLASTNGTYWNGVRIGVAPTGPLRPRDIIQFGKVAVQVVPVTRPARSWSELTLPSPWSETETIRVRAPNRAGPLMVYPLLRSSPGRVDYALPEEAMADGGLTVSEVSAEGRISELVVENRGQRRVLFIEGEELRGGKQNRILNTTVMVPAGGTITVPVSCVERGRWSTGTQTHMGTGSVSSAQIRHTVRSSVTRSLHDGRGHSSDQGSVWNDVRSQHDALGVTSRTDSMADTVTSCADRVATVQQALPYPEGSTGVLVAVGRRIVSLDLFDAPDTCRRVWDRLVTGLSLDGLMAGAEDGEPSLDQISSLFARARAAAWVPVRAVGDGAESRADFDGLAGSALIVDGVLVHGSLVGGKLTA
jgi:pSer/pThr/pTyr-binding forkhead associated (FHA) protein